MTWGDAQIKDVALRAWCSVINSNKSEKKSFEFGRKDGKVCAGRICMLCGGQAAADPGTAGNKGAELLVKFVLWIYPATGVGIKVREERGHKLLNLSDAPLRNEMPCR